MGRSFSALAVETGSQKRGTFTCSASQARLSAGRLVSITTSWALFKSSLAGVEEGRGQVAVDLHVADRQGHVPVRLGEEEVGGGGAAGHLEGLADVDAQLAAGGGDALGVEIVAEGGEQPGVYTQKAHVVGDVPAHAAQADAHRAGIGILSHQLSEGPTADVDVNGAHHGGVGGVAQHM